MTVRSLLGRLVAGPAGVVLPERLTASVRDPRIAYDLELEIRILYGRPICVSLEAHQREGGPPVTRSGLNSLPVDKIVREASSRHALRVRSSQKGTSTLSRASTEEQETARKALGPKLGRPGDPAARRGRLIAVATAYQELTQAGVKHPRKALAAQFTYAPASIGRLIAEARREGFLGAAPGPGRAGSIGSTKS
jgi:hypothetical protein